MLVVIGPRWLTLTDAAGRRRIDDQQDWIRREIVAALGLRLRVIPVLLDRGVLPADIAGLSRRQYVPLRRRYTRIDLDNLVEQITEADPGLAAAKKGRASVRRSSAMKWVGIVGILAAIAAGATTAFWLIDHATTATGNTASTSASPAVSASSNGSTSVGPVTATSTTPTELGPEVPPPTGYGQVARLLSANGFAIEERPTATQAGVLAVAAHPTSANSQRWPSGMEASSTLTQRRWCSRPTVRTANPLRAKAPLSISNLLARPLSHRLIIPPPSSGPSTKQAVPGTRSPTISNSA